MPSSGRFVSEGRLLIPLENMDELRDKRWTYKVIVDIQYILKDEKPEGFVGKSEIVLLEIAHSFLAAQTQNNYIKLY